MVGNREQGTGNREQGIELKVLESIFNSCCGDTANQLALTNQK
jgi:hypothetical protein